MFFFHDPSRSESIRVDPTRTGRSELIRSDFCTCLLKNDLKKFYLTNHQDNYYNVPPISFTNDQNFPYAVRFCNDLLRIKRGQFTKTCPLKFHNVEHSKIVNNCLLLKQLFTS